MFDWLSDNRASIALFIILALIVSFIWSIIVGRKQTKLRAKDEVFGDPERTKGGWYWAVCGISALLLLWFHYSWGTARAVFPNAANELCQIAKIDESMASISAALPIGSRYLKSTTLVVRNGQQVNKLATAMPVGIFSATEEAELNIVLGDINALMATLSNPDYVDPKAIDDLADVERSLGDLVHILRQGPNGATPTAAALAQPKWGTSEVEIPMLPMTPRGVLFDKISAEVIPITDQFLSIRNMSPKAKKLIARTKTTIANLKKPDPSMTLDEAGKKIRNAYIKSVDRIFKRLDDGVIFPSVSMQGMHHAVADIYGAVDDAKGSLGIIEALFFPGQGIVKSRTLSTEQGSGRWL
ncbi:MAG: ABC transporter permease, partial [Candidatus Puniceispirillum sp.]|nr:ABC transporter permease [Candidatus Puniceispirillum sp.]